MKREPIVGADWMAPLYALLPTFEQKGSHKLPAMPCVLWLPDYRAYLKSLDLNTARFTVSHTPEAAMRLADDQAELLAQDLIDVTGVRVHLRHYVAH